MDYYLSILFLAVTTLLVAEILRNILTRFTSRNSPIELSETEAKHMASTSNASFAREAVWLGGKHDGHAISVFEAYKETRESAMRLDELKKSNALQYAALHQSHLSLGLIEAVTEEAVSESLLLQIAADGRIFMVTHNIPSILRRWLSRARAMQAADPERHKQWYTRARTALEKAHADLEIEVHSPHSSYFRKAGLSAEDVSRIIFMIAAIGEALAAASNHFLLMPSKTLNWTFVLASADECVKEMIVQGWCPFTVALLSQSVCRLGFASTVKPLIRTGTASDGHQKCTQDGCIMNTIDTATYTNRHATTACHCSYSRPPRDLVMNNLSHNRIPVITFANTDEPSEFVHMTCEDSTTIPYVAISHVWADGLGSTTDDGLPTCQLRRLDDLTRRLIPGGALWMDSLCVPRDRETRKRAIGLMGQTYKDATIVLVIDSGIRSCSILAPLEERLLRIVTSAWMQRLWTFQEAALARKLVFEFADGLVEIGELLPDLQGMLDVVSYTLAAEINRLLKRRELSRYEKWGKPGFGIGDVTRALGWRTTSKLEDETLAVASLLNLDAFELVNLPPEKRMFTMLVRLRNVPPNVLFLAGKKLQERGFRWAPETFMIRGGLQLDVSDLDAVCTPEGLLATYPCVSFDTTTFREGETWYLRGTPGNRCFSIRSMGSAGIVREYTCNTILLRNTQPQVIDVGVAVLADKDDQTHADTGEFRPTCVYMLRVLITRTNARVLERSGAAKVLDARESGRLRVFLT